MVSVRHVMLRLGVALLLVVATACGGAGGTPSSPSVQASEGESALPSASPSEAAMLPTTTEPADEAPAGAIEIQVGPGPNFEPDNITAPAGDSVTFFLNMSAASEHVQHNFKIGPELPPGLAIAVSDVMKAGESAVVTVTGLEPGTYQFWCSIMDHYSFGMHGTLTVE